MLRDGSDKEYRNVIINVYAIGIGVRDGIEVLKCLMNSSHTIFSVKDLNHLKILVDKTIDGHDY